MDCAKRSRRPPPGLGLCTVLTTAAALRLWRLSQNGFGNEYYTAGVRSMSLSWHNFLYSSFDPAGFISVDKPPVALWIQVASVKLFGFHALRLLGPQALEGVAAVAVLYHLVQRRFGAAAGLLAALFLALTPVSVAIDRSSNTDSCLVLVLLLAAWALTLAVEQVSLPFLALAMGLVGRRVQRQDARRVRRPADLCPGLRRRRAAGTATPHRRPRRRGRRAGRGIFVAGCWRTISRRRSAPVRRHHQQELDARARGRPLRHRPLRSLGPVQERVDRFGERPGRSATQTAGGTGRAGRTGTAARLLTPVRPGAGGSAAARRRPARRAGRLALALRAGRADARCAARSCSRAVVSGAPRGALWARLAGDVRRRSTALREASSTSIISPRWRRRSRRSPASAS